MRPACAVCGCEKLRADYDSKSLNYFLSLKHNISCQDCRKKGIRTRAGQYRVQTGGVSHLCAKCRFDMSGQLAQGIRERKREKKSVEQKQMLEDLFVVLLENQEP